MNNPLAVAPKLAKNPLGIIALFIVLVYGVAALVVGTDGGNLMPEHKLPIIWFLVLFPPIVLFCFVWLVANHHMKLYSPSDFENQSLFAEINNSEFKSAVDKYTKDLGEQLELAKKKIEELKISLGASEQDKERLEKAKLTYEALLKKYEEINESKKKDKISSINSIIESAELSDDLAEATSLTPVKRKSVIDIIESATKTMESNQKLMDRIANISHFFI